MVDQTPQLHQTLHQVFGYDTFRPGQREVIEALEAYPYAEVRSWLERDRGQSSVAGVRV